MELKETVEMLKTVVVVGAGAGAFLGGLMVAAWLTLRTRLQRVHSELTDKQNGSFRGEFTRFRDAQDRRFNTMVDRLSSMDERLDSRDERQRARAEGFEVRIEHLEEGQTAISDQCNMVLEHLDQLTCVRAKKAGGESCTSGGGV